MILLTKFHKKTGNKSRNHVKINTVMLAFVCNIEGDGTKIMTILILQIKEYFRSLPLALKAALFTEKVRGFLNMLTAQQFFIFTIFSKFKILNKTR